VELFLALALVRQPTGPRKTLRSPDKKPLNGCVSSVYKQSRHKSTWMRRRQKLHAEEILNKQLLLLSNFHRCIERQLTFHKARWFCLLRLRLRLRLRL
jgi:hypothetical protein